MDKPIPTSAEIQPESPGRVQLIDAAIRAVAAHGRKGATVRIIAEDASVTAGLIKHHFDTKAGLLQEADNVIASRFKMAMTPPAENLSADETIKTIASQLSTLIAAEPELRAYVRRSLLEATSSGAEIFNQLVDVTFEQIRKYRPEKTMTKPELRWTAAQVVAINLAGLMFEPFLDKWTKQPSFSTDEVARRTDANTRFIHAGLIDALST